MSLNFWITTSSHVNVCFCVSLEAQGIREVQENDWIRLYLELAVAKTVKKRGETHSLTTLKILKVATESTRDLPPFKKGLAAFDATFYIRYEDSCEARVGKDVHRIALVRRILDDETEKLHLVGCHQSTAAMEAGSSSAQESI